MYPMNIKSLLSKLVSVCTCKENGSPVLGSVAFSVGVADAEAEAVVAAVTLIELPRVDKFDADVCLEVK